jgi:hypothetical protein
MAKVKINIGGKEVEAEKITFKAKSEPWSEYYLEDGNVAKIKLVVTEAYLLPGRDTVTGLPQYAFKSSNVATIETSESSKGDH